MKIRLNIDRVVLDGYALRAGDRNRFLESLQAELEQVVIAEARAGRLATGYAVRHTSGTPIAFQPGADARHLGKLVAHSIQGELGQGADAPAGTTLGKDSGQR